jgi:hypothetical protein
MFMEVLALLISDDSVNEDWFSSGLQLLESILDLIESSPKLVFYYPQSNKSQEGLPNLVNEDNLNDMVIREISTDLISGNMKGDQVSIFIVSLLLALQESQFVTIQEKVANLIIILTSMWPETLDERFYEQPNIALSVTNAVRVMTFAKMILSSSTLGKFDYERRLLCLILNHTQMMWKILKDRSVNPIANKRLLSIFKHGKNSALWTLVDMATLKSFCTSNIENWNLTRDWFDARRNVKALVMRESSQDHGTIDPSNRDPIFDVQDEKQMLNVEGQAHPS